MNRTTFFRCLGALAIVGPLATASVRQTTESIDESKPPRRVVKSEAEWKKILTPDEFAIARQHGTERAFSSPLAKNHERGEYRCVCCHEPLFRSETKFESGTGWPSFYAPISKNVVKDVKDTSYGMVRTEVQCAVCDAHLGHVFNDGPEPTSLRYCMNGVSLEFVKK
ncbi:peptide-methionine (R)-S-oxide reductase MsrB [Spirosoma flavus]